MLKAQISKENSAKCLSGSYHKRKNKWKRRKTSGRSKEIELPKCGKNAWKLQRKLLMKKNHNFTIKFKI